MMRPMLRRLLAGVALLACWAGAPAVATGADPVRLFASFDRGARLGQPTAMRFGLEVDPHRLAAPLSEIRIRYPAGLGIATSGLGLAACRRPADEFERVMVTLTGLAGCSPNSVMGYGTAVAQVRMGAQTISATARMTMLAGPVEDGRVRLLAFVDGMNPFGVRLLYGGELRPAPRPFGEVLSVRFPQAPDAPRGARLALVRVDLDIGSRRVVYRDGRGARYRPEGISLPARCPAGGLRFAADVLFLDGRRAAATTTLPCPPAAPRAHAH